MANHSLPLTEFMCKQHRSYVPINRIQEVLAVVRASAARPKFWIALASDAVRLAARRNHAANSNDFGNYTKFF